MFTFLVPLLLIMLCYIIYVYLSNQILAQRKRIMLLVKQNNELKSKLNKLMSSPAEPKPDDEPEPELHEETEVSDET